MADGRLFHTLVCRSMKSNTQLIVDGISEYAPNLLSLTFKRNDAGQTAPIVGAAKVLGFNS